MRPLLACLAAWSCALPITAQVPIDHALVLEASTVVNAPNYRFVDVFGAGGATLSNQSVWLQPPPVAVAVDPVDAAFFYFAANTASVPGVWRSQVGLLGAIGTSQWGPWFQGAATRIEVGATRVFALRNGNLESCSRVPGGAPPAVHFTAPGLVDLAVAGARVYVVFATTVFEVDTAAASIRQVGSYPGVRALAASPVANELCLGLQSGDVVRVDATTGIVLATTTTGLGPIVAVGYTRLGTLLWADAAQLWSELAPGGPIHVASSPIVDFGVGVAPAATVQPFGNGCAVGATASWTTAGAPTLGNAQFALGCAGAPGNALSLLALGLGRYSAATLGVPLPFDLAAVGAPGCALRVDPETVVARIATASGLAQVGVPIPNLPGLVGLQAHGQWFLADPATGPLGLAAMPGVTFVLR